MDIANVNYSAKSFFGYNKYLVIVAAIVLTIISLRGPFGYEPIFLVFLGPLAIFVIWTAYLRLILPAATIVHISDRIKKGEAISNGRTIILLNFWTFTIIAHLMELIGLYLYFTRTAAADNVFPAIYIEGVLFLIILMLQLFFVSLLGKLPPQIPMVTTETPKITLQQIGTAIVIGLFFIAVLAGIIFLMVKPVIF